MTDSVDPTGLQILSTPKKRATYRPAALRTNSHSRGPKKDVVGSVSGPGLGLGEPRAVERSVSKLSRCSTAASSTSIVGGNGGGVRGEEVTREHWRPDASVSTCGACPTSFSFLERKHHCRRCGGIFCSEHSRYTVALNQDASFSQTGQQNKRACPRCRRDFELWMNPPNIQRPTATQQQQQQQQQQVRPQKMMGRGGGNNNNNASAGAGEEQDEMRGMPAASVPTDWTWSTF